VVCYGFIVASWAVIAVWLTAAGVALADIYRQAAGTGLPKQQVGTGIPVSGTTGNQ